MLVLYRKPGDSIFIGESIEIIIDKVEDGTVKVLVDAPREIAVHRHDYHRPDHRRNSARRNHGFRSRRDDSRYD